MGDARQATSDGRLEGISCLSPFLKGLTASYIILCIRHYDILVKSGIPHSDVVLIALLDSLFCSNKLGFKMGTISSHISKVAEI